MAFNKGLRFVDSGASPLDRYGLTIDNTSQSFFESNSPTAAYGAMVLTLRPAKGSASDKQALIVGDNLAIGIEYNAAGDQYRLLMQDAVNYATANKFKTTHNTVFGEFAAVNAETTFAFNWNANGTASIVQTGESVRTKYMTPWTVQAEPVVVAVTADVGGGAKESYAILLDDGKGNIAEIGDEFNASTTAAQVATGLTTKIDALTGYTATANGSNITVTRSDGGSFQLSDGHPANFGFSTTDSTGKLKVGGVVISTPQGAKGGSIGMDANYSGFISQIAEFSNALSVSNMNNYVTDPSSIPDPTVGSDTSSKAVVTVVAEAKNFELQLDDGTGNQSAKFTSDGDGANAHAILTELATSFSGLSAASKAGFTVTAVNDNAGNPTHLDITRADGADFTVTSLTANANNIGANKVKVNGVFTTLDQPFASSTVGSSSMAIVVGTPDLGKNYQVVLDDGAGNQDTVSYFSPSANSSAAQVATALKNKIDALTNYTATVNTATITVSRTDGKEFKVKLGAEDNAGDLKVDTVALTTGFVSVNNDQVDGVTATLSNGVKQKLLLTNLTDAFEIVGSGPGDYTGEATLSLKGLKLADGTLATLASDGTTVKVTSTAFNGGAPPAAVAGAVASDGIFTQVRNVEGNAGTKTMLIDVFVDPKFTGAALKSLSYTVAVDTGLDIQNFTQVNAAQGYSLGSPNGQNVSARWFSSQGLTDLTDPIATIAVKENTTTNNPTFTFSNVEINGADLTDGTTYTATFAETLDAAIVDVTGTLISGLDNTTKAAGNYVLGTVAPGATTSLPLPNNGLYLDVSAWQVNAATPNDAIYTLAVKAATAVDLFEFDLELPGQTDMTSVVFTADAGLPADVVVATNAVTGRTLEVKATGSTIAAGSTLGTITVTVPGEFGKVQLFELSNVQTNASAANENGRGLYAGIAETNASGVWTLDDMGAGLFNRVYDGGPAVTAATVTAVDAFYALQVSAGLVPSWYSSSVTEGQVIASDFDGSGKVTAADALAILEYVGGTNVPVPAPTVYDFYHDRAATDATITAVDAAKALTTNHVLSTSDLDLTNQLDRVVLIGDLSNPAV